MRKQRSIKALKAYLKLAFYSGAVMLVGIGMAGATLDEQVTKASAIVLGNLASLVVGGATAVGGGMAVFQGNVMKGLGIVGVGATIGIGIALAKSKTIFDLLQ
jgi:hypothetical protein